jgi:hypothetical protein
MTADDENREAIIRGLKAILDAPGTSGKHVEAKASAARQLAALELDGEVVAIRQEEPPDADPMADLDRMEHQRRRRSRK